MGETRPPDGDSPEVPPAVPRSPTLLDALIPLLALIGCIALTVITFGVDATAGPLQVALLLGATVAGLMAFKNGYSAAYVRDAAIGGVASGMAALFILLAVGALIGTWNMAGTIPTIVYYGIGLLSATWFYAATAIVCALVGLAIGSSWTTAATVGVALVAMAPLLGASPVIAAGAVISGAYFGDKMTPLSETTILVPSLVGGVSTNEHIGAMIWTSGVAIAIAIGLFAVLGFAIPPAAVPMDPAAAQAVLAAEFWISPINLLPLAAARHPPFRQVAAVPRDPQLRALRRLARALHPAGVGRGLRRQAGRGAPRGRASTALFAAMATGFVSSTGTSRSTRCSPAAAWPRMLSTIWLVLAALSFGAIMEQRRLPGAADPPGRRRAPTSTGRLIAAVDLHVHRVERRRRRPVRRRRPAQPRLSRPSSRGAAWRRGCCRGPSRTPAR